MKKWINGIIVVALMSSMANGKMFRDSNTEIIVDTDTHLMWQDNDEVRSKYIDWTKAMDYCENLSFAGYDDWKLPDINSLQNLHQYNAVLEKHKENSSYWSSTIRNDGKIFEYYCDYNGDCWKPRVSSKEDTNYPRCVRSGKSSDPLVKKYDKYVADEKKAEQVREDAYNAKIAKFRKNLQEGDDTSSGIVIQIKGNLVKIQTNDSQCSQRDYKGNCNNWINTPVEKWVKRNELYPN
ncbi:MAG: DUF1566 domain-containing protein [Sulfuricurvum sp.]|uniref:Lcl C-terminal domain-containing protein n=1 Tax=Sulfuricurvum sp. TaxID=2025608 RepID=UPI002617CCE7|nr:DUF1566 domain-containing protein [Sulfuricurvum sp.]MDD2830311.1 DUF1566 domain-containing protein [Sulfuricurvum sp.]MDD4949181.1 DUF1566 domain-containing protein [Sulfuricurvum sp.]